MVSSLILMLDNSIQIACPGLYQSGSDFCRHFVQVAAAFCSLWYRVPLNGPVGISFGSGWDGTAIKTIRRRVFHRVSLPWSSRPRSSNSLERACIPSLFAALMMSSLEKDKRILPTNNIVLTISLPSPLASLTMKGFPSRGCTECSLRVFHETSRFWRIAPWAAHSLSSQNWKPTSSVLPTDLSLSFFCFHQTHDYYAYVFAVCMCVCVWRVCVLKCMFLSAFVSALGSPEIGRHRLPIIIIVLSAPSTVSILPFFP